MTPAPVFSIRNLDFYYGSKLALSKINMDILPRQVTALIGPSGCGKSTFLRCLNRMNDTIPGTRLEGEMLLEGQNIYAPDYNVAEPSPAGGDGLPEAESIPAVRLRQRRFRSAHPGHGPKQSPTG